MNKSKVDQKVNVCSPNQLYTRSTQRVFKLDKMLFVMLFASMLLLLFSSEVFALGVAPSREVMNYDQQPHTYTLRIVNNEHKNMKVLVYAQGELAEYVKTMEQTTFIVRADQSEVPFTYTITLPQNIDPGTKDLDIAVVEVPDTAPESGSTSGQEKTMVLSSVVVIYQLKVNVPYPGLFAEGYLYVSEGNVNEPIVFTANIVNKGTNPIAKIDGELIIKGPTNEELSRIKTDSLVNIDPQNSQKLTVTWPATVNAGTYDAELVLNYDGKLLVLKKTFNVGNYNIDVSNVAVNDFRLGAIAKFDIDVTSKWNQPIDDVYADMQVLDQQGTVLSNFKTSSVQVPPLMTEKLNGYWDTKDMNIGTYDVKVILHYAGKTSERIFSAVVGIDSIHVQDTAGTAKVIASTTAAAEQKTSGSISLLTILVIILIVINIGWFIYFKFLKKQTPQ